MGFCTGQMMCLSLSESAASGKYCLSPRKTACNKILTNDHGNVAYHCLCAVMTRPLCFVGSQRLTGKVAVTRYNMQPVIAFGGTENYESPFRTDIS